MPDMPVGLDWAAVTTGVTDFLGNALVIGGLAAVLALRFVPGFLRAVRSIVTGR